MTETNGTLSIRESLKIKSREGARRRVEELDGRDRCLCCGYEGYIEVHHIDGDWLNNHPLNLVPLCRRCHYHAHSSKRTAERVQEMREEFEEQFVDA
jgi:hypothetical protein